MLSIYRLPNQLPDEKIVKILRRDAFILFKKVIVFIFLMVLFIAFVYLYESLFPEAAKGQYLPLLILVASAFLLFIWLFFFFSFIDYYLDVWIVTNERIISIEQEGFFARIISEQRLFRVQDVTSEIEGLFPTLFKYGNVYIQTAAEKERFTFEQVPDPNEVRDVIIKLAEIDRERVAKE